MICGRSLVLVLAGSTLMVSVAAAQGVLFTYGIGDPYSDPYYQPRHRVYVGPPVYYDEPPLGVEPAEPGLPSRVVVSPDEVQEDLEGQGFSRFGPVDARAGSYAMTAVDPGGNLVSLTVSMRSGQIISLRVLEPSQRAQPAAPRRMPGSAPAVASVPRTRPAAPQAAAPAPVATAPSPDAPGPTAAAPPAPKKGKDPLVVY